MRAAGLCRRGVGVGAPRWLPLLRPAAQPARHHIYGHGEHHGHGHGHGHPDGEEHKPWSFPKDADPASFFQPPEPERPDVTLALEVALAPAARRAAEGDAAVGLEVEAAFFGYVDRLSACRGVLSATLLRHHECLQHQPWPESEPEPEAGPTTGAWTLRCQLADHASLPQDGALPDPLALGLPPALAAAGACDGDEGWYSVQRTLQLSRSRPMGEPRPLPPPPSAGRR